MTDGRDVLLAALGGDAPQATRELLERVARALPAEDVTALAAAITDAELLLGPEAAELGGVTAGNWRSLAHLRYTPEPDDVSVPQRPRWRRWRVREWRESRPGSGRRAVSVKRAPKDNEEG